MQRKLLLTLTAASTLAVAALLGGALWSTASFVKSNATAQVGQSAASHSIWQCARRRQRPMDFGLKCCRRATRVTAAGVSRRIEEDWE